VPELIATWNPALGVWERPETNLLCGHQVPYTETWPASVMTRSGRLYELPTLAHRTAGNESSSQRSLLPTPAAGRFGEGESLESWDARNAILRAKGINGNGMGATLPIAVLQLLKTPTAQLAVNGGSQHPDKRRAGGHGPTLADQIEHLLPTPGACDWKGSGQTQGRTRNGRPRPPGDKDLPEAVALLPTPRAQNAEDRNSRIWLRPMSEPQNLENALARLPGAPTSLLSDAGKPSSGAPRQARLSPGEPETA